MRKKKEIVKKKMDTKLESRITGSEDEIDIKKEREWEKEKIREERERR